MQENCKTDCPVLPRVEALERANEQHSSTHREMFSRLNNLERETDSQEVMLQNIDVKLDEVKATVSALAEKPGKRWDGLVDKLIYLVAVAVVAWAAAGAPGLG